MYSIQLFTVADTGKKSLNLPFFTETQKFAVAGLEVFNTFELLEVMKTRNGKLFAWTFLEKKTWKS